MALSIEDMIAEGIRYMKGSLIIQALSSGISQAGDLIVHNVDALDAISSMQ